MPREPVYPDRPEGEIDPDVVPHMGVTYVPPVRRARLVGTRTTKGRAFGTVTFNSKPLDPARSQDLWDHSPDGFAWGYGGSGPAQLALAVLLELGLSDEEAVRDHQEFKRRVIAHLPFGGDFDEEVRWPL